MSARWYQLQFQVTQPANQNQNQDFQFNNLNDMDLEYRLQCGDQIVTEPLIVNPETGLTEPIIIHESSRKCANYIYTSFNDGRSRNHHNAEELMRGRVNEMRVESGVTVKLASLITNEKLMGGRRLVTTKEGWRYSYRERDHKMPYFGPAFPPAK